jgi:hypothetical protein
LTVIASHRGWTDAVGTMRDVVRNNARIEAALFDVETDETWLPAVLVQAGFFPSNSEVKKNQPSLWRDVLRPLDVVRLSWAEIAVRS